MEDKSIYLRNDETNVTCYKVNENVPFKKEWLYSILSSKLPWYYKTLSITIIYKDIVTKSNIKETMDKLSEKFALVIFNRYIKENIVEYTIVTNKTLYQIQRELYIMKIGKEVKNVKYIY